MEIEKSVQMMDSARITMVRSTMNNKVIKLEGYTYNFEDRGMNTIRWICAKRKEENCRAYVITTSVVGDETSHVVVRINGIHKCSNSKQQESSNSSVINLTTEEENVEIKYNLKKNRLKRYERLQPHHVQLVNSHADEEEEYSEEIPQYMAEEENEMKEEEGDDEEFFLSNYDSIKKKKTAEPFDDFEHNKVYLLRTHNSRELVLVDGFLYRLEGKSKTSATFRWECIRTDINCKTRIYTERHNETKHTLKHLAGSPTLHDHQPYTPQRVSELIKRHKIIVVYDEVQDPVGIKKSKVQTKTTHQAAAKKITLLPSIKGQSSICVGNMIYNFESLSPCKRRSYWRCLYRDHKQYKCKAFIITTNSNKGIVISKLNDNHKHNDHRAELRNRLGSSGEKKLLNQSSSINTAKKQQQLPVKTNQKKNIIAKAFDMSGYESSTSCESMLSDTPNLPETLEDMQQKNNKNSTILKDEKNIDLAPPEHIDFVDVDYLENEHSYDALNETDELEVKPPIKRERKRKSNTMSSDKFQNDDIPTTANRSGKRRRRTNISLKEESNDDDDAEFKFENHNDDEDEDEEEFIDSKAKVSIKRVKRRRKSIDFASGQEYDMDITKVSELRSAKGGKLLCVDGYIYHMKSEANRRNYWICIKNRDYSVKCKSFVRTSDDDGEIKVVRVTNKHNHPVNENDIKRRLCNELTASGVLPKKISKANYFLNRTLDEIKADCSAILSVNENSFSGIDLKRKMKLYAVSDGPPSLAVRMTLKALGIPYELINVDYISAEHLTESYEKMNPQKEIPVLDDDGFYLSESIAIMQYLCDKYAPKNELYPKEARARALVNHRLCFNMGFYYASISMHAMAPIFFDYQRNEMTLKKVNNALAVFEKYLERSGTKYAADDNLTIADFALVSATLCLEAIEFDLSPYPLVTKWYENFKEQNPKIWEIGLGGMLEIADFNKNPPDLSNMNHPFHPTRKV